MQRLLGILHSKRPSSQILGFKALAVCVKKLLLLMILNAEKASAAATFLPTQLALWSRTLSWRASSPKAPGRKSHSINRKLSFFMSLNVSHDHIYVLHLRNIQQHNLIFFQAPEKLATSWAGTLLQSLDALNATLTLYIPLQYSSIWMCGKSSPSHGIVFLIWS